MQGVHASPVISWHYSDRRKRDISVKPSVRMVVPTVSNNTHAALNILENVVNPQTPFSQI